MPHPMRSSQSTPEITPRARTLTIEGLTPPPYDAFAQRYFAKLQDYPTAFTSVSEVSEAVFAAATEEGDRLRFPAGPDTALFAQLRWMTSEEHYLAQMRAMFGPDLSE
ncbi:MULTISPECIES: hypothetical protein [Acetobacter]|uniref:hypothetical protein n=1 Tax=Acetobacter TaxID=434 RepID=UPI00376FF002